MKVTHLREDLLSIVGGYKEALLLDYLLVVCDYDEDKCVSQNLEQISEGSQLFVSPAAVCKYLGELVNKDYVKERGRKRFVNIRKIRKDLELGGYKLVRL